MADRIINWLRGNPGDSGAGGGERKAPNTITPEAVLGIKQPYVVRLANGELRPVAGLFDIDGTRNNEKRLEADRLSTVTEATRAITTAQAMDISVGAATGRSFGEAEMYRKACGDVGMTIAEDGGIVVLPETIDAVALAKIEDLKDESGNKKYRIVDHNGRKVILVSNIVTADIRKLWEDFTTNHPLEPGQEVATTFDAPERIQAIVGHGGTSPDAVERQKEAVAAAAASADRVVSAYVKGLKPDQLDALEEMAQARDMKLSSKNTALPHIVGKDGEKGKALRVVDDIVRTLLFDSYGYAGIYPIGIGNNSNDISLFEDAIQLCGGEGLAFIVAEPTEGVDPAEYVENPHYFVPGYHVGENPNGVYGLPRPFGFGMEDAIQVIQQKLPPRQQQQ